jgi:hypothetical protein
MYKCLKCEAEFYDAGAYCEDHKDSNRKLGCPNCKAFYRKSKRASDWTLSLSIIIFSISIMGFIRALINEELSSSVAFCFIFISSGILHLKYIAPRHKQVKIEYVTKA